MFIPRDGSTKTIDGAAFLQFTGLTAIAIPNSVKKIGAVGASAFDGCTSLSYISYGGNIETWESVA